MKKIILSCLFFFSLEAEMLKLYKVYDGDTALFSNNTVCRFAYIDTPESKMNIKTKKDIQKTGFSKDINIFSGRMASRYTKSILQKGAYYQVKILGDESHGWGRKNKKRAICLIYTQDGKNINEMIVKNGFGVPFYRYIHSCNLRKKYTDLVRYAKENKKGLWRIYPEFMESFLDIKK